MARMDSEPDFYCLACEDILIENWEMRIWHYLCKNNNNPMIIWIFNRITMTVLCNIDKIDGPNIEYESENYERSDSVRVFDDQPHLLVVPNLVAGSAFHCDMNGHPLAGSNTFGSGPLCLGEQFAPYDFSAIHLLCNYNANPDLGWIGPALSIHTPIENHQRILSQPWPRIPRIPQINIPPEISGFFNR